MDIRRPLTSGPDIGDVTRKLVTNYAYTTWNGVASVTENSALLDENVPPNGFVARDDLAYTQTARSPRSRSRRATRRSTVFRRRDQCGYGRLKAWGMRTRTANTKEMIRFNYDSFGNSIEQRVLDNISSSSLCNTKQFRPCRASGSTLEDCGPVLAHDLLDDTQAAAYDAITNGPPRRRIFEVVAPDASKFYTYTNGQLTQLTDFSNNRYTYSYDTSAASRRL